MHSGDAISPSVSIVYADDSAASEGFLRKVAV